MCWGDSYCIQIFSQTLGYAMWMYKRILMIDRRQTVRLYSTQHYTIIRGHYHSLRATRCLRSDSSRLSRMDWQVNCRPVTQRLIEFDSYSDVKMIQSFLTLKNQSETRNVVRLTQAIQLEHTTNTRGRHLGAFVLQLEARLVIGLFLNTLTPTSRDLHRVWYVGCTIDILMGKGFRSNQRILVRCCINSDDISPLLSVWFVWSILSADLLLIEVFLFFPLISLWISPLH